MSRKKIEYLEGTMEPGLTGIRGSSGKCAIANQLREQHGAIRPKVGLRTISFTIGDIHYEVQTPADLAVFQHGFDKYGADGTVETVSVATAYRIPVSGKTVISKPVEHMSEEAKARLTQAKRSPDKRARDDASSALSKAKLKARVA